ncbi:hypothetical protein [Anaerolinea thermolimosa]|nr:hypothetical protein [Anaerolinea thermolimosa]
MNRKWLKTTNPIFPVILSFLWLALLIGLGYCLLSAMFQLFL